MAGVSDRPSHNSHGVDRAEIIPIEPDLDHASEGSRREVRPCRVRTAPICSGQD